MFGLSLHINYPSVFWSYSEANAEWWTLHSCYVRMEEYVCQGTVWFCEVSCFRFIL